MSDETKLREDPRRAHGFPALGNERDRIRTLEARVAELEARVFRLEGALDTYGQHVGACRSVRSDAPCICGLDHALRGSPSVAPSEEGS
jgi:hypothetical protein